MFIPFHTKNTRYNRQLHVKINEDCIFVSSKVKYLGVMFSRQGQTHLQADNNARSASCALNVIKVLSAQPRANSPKILLVWYGAWCARGHAAHHRLGPSPSHQQDGRHAGSWATRSAPHILVYIEAGVLPLWQYIQLSAAKYKFRCQTVANSSLKEIHIRVLQEPCPSPVLLFQL